MRDDVELGERGRRRAANEAAFRDINERVASLNATFAEFTNEFVILCECHDTRCVEQIPIRPDEYDAVRREPTLFAIVPGHDDPAVEDTVEDHGHYHVVRKRPGEPEKIAVATDPRAG